MISRLSHERRQFRTARHARIFLPRCSVLSPMPAAASAANANPFVLVPAAMSPTSTAVSNVNTSSGHSLLSVIFDGGIRGAARAVGDAEAAAVVEADDHVSGYRRSSRKGIKRTAGPTSVCGKPGVSAVPGAVSRSAICRAPVGHWDTQAGASPSASR